MPIESTSLIQIDTAITVPREIRIIAHSWAESSVTSSYLRFQMRVSEQFRETYRPVVRKRTEGSVEVEWLSPSEHI